MRAPALLLAVLLAAAGCSGSSGSPVASASASPTSSAASDAFAGLQPPTSPGIGDFDNLHANRAYVATQGFLAAQLLEPASLSGLGSKDLITLIQGAAGDPAPSRALTGTSAAGLRYRPLLAKGVLLPKGFATVVRSTYTGEEVRGQSGEMAVRITWSGALHYAVRVKGKPLTFAYALKIAYIYSKDAVDPAGMNLQVTVPLSVHIAPASTDCLAKGLVLPVAGTISDVDDGEGRYPKPKPGPACPV